MKKITVSLIKVDVGRFLGHSTMRSELKEKAREQMEKGKKKGCSDYHILNAGNDLQLLMSRRIGVDSDAVQELLVDAFSGNIKGMGPGIVEMEFTERGQRGVTI
ncbi:MAG: fructose 1,6-bisphosphatase [Proteobacteria bacterium]|nr:fructose 1,6-bisphosphatase [Pseudomonadota bacterium]